MKSLAAQHGPLVIDVSGTRLTAADKRRLRSPWVGGVIHFARNWESRAQLVALNAEIKAIRGDLLICVDHEGGRVQRFKSDGFTHLPAMRELGERWHADSGRGDGRGPLSAMRAATDCGYVLGAELRACGVDLSFAPVLDLDWGASGVIGDRAFSHDHRVVSMLAQAVLHGLLQAGMAHCAKHFPGHGFAQADSHTAIAVDPRPLKAILADDAAPYQQLAGSLLAVMPAHVIYPRTDALPAGFSSRWLQDVLRGQLGFQGAIVSDDLSMQAARQIGGRCLSYTEAILTALAAGCDLVLLCNQSVSGGTVLDDVLEGMTQACDKASFVPRASSAQRRLDLLPQSRPMPWDDLMVNPRYVAALDSV